MIADACHRRAGKNKNRSRKALGRPRLWREDAKQIRLLRALLWREDAKQIRLLRALRTAGYGSAELLDAVEEAMDLGLRQELDAILAERFEADADDDGKDGEWWREAAGPPDPRRADWPQQIRALDCGSGDHLTRSGYDRPPSWFATLITDRHRRWDEITGDGAQDVAR
jgi:hypothetical protein